MGLTLDEAVMKFSDGYAANGGNIFSEDGKFLYSYGRHFVLAYRANSPHCTFIINGDKYSVSTSRHQSICQSYLDGITVGASAFPFNLFRELERKNAVVVDAEKDKHWHNCWSEKLPDWATPQNGAEYRYDKDGELVAAHRPGGLLVKLKKPAGSRGIKAAAGYYLCGMDEGSYFCVLLPSTAKPETILEAFEALEPEEVTMARRGGLTVRRQGEWYFVEPLEPIFTRNLAEIKLDDKFKRRYKNGGFATDGFNATTNTQTMNELRLNLRALDFTPLQPASSKIGNLHCVREIRQDEKGNIFCRGKVVHRRTNSWNGASRATGEHKSVMLKRWHQVFRNTARAAWSAVGSVD